MCYKNSLLALQRVYDVSLEVILSAHLISLIHSVYLMSYFRSISDLVAVIIITISRWFKFILFEMYQHLKPKPFNPFYLKPIHAQNFVV